METLFLRFQGEGGNRPQTKGRGRDSCEREKIGRILDREKGISLRLKEEGGNRSQIRRRGKKLASISWVRKE